MNNYKGEDLLNVFNELNVDLQKLSPNVIKGWFDTDCPDMKNMLNWMCSSLSKSNYISAQQTLEYSCIESPLVDAQQERACDQLEKIYPGIFDVESNLLHIEIAADEIECLEEDEKHVDKLLKLNEKLQQSLMSDLSETRNAKEIKVSLSCKETEIACEELAEHFDDLNEQLNSLIQEHMNDLYCFETNNGSKVHINNLDNSDFKRKFENNVPSFVSCLNANETTLTSDSLDCDDPFAVALKCTKKRLYCSRKRYLLHKLKKKELSRVLDYMKECTNIESVLSLTESVHLQLNIESKEEMLPILIKDAANSFAQLHLIQPKLTQSKKELEFHQSKFNILQHLSELAKKLLSRSYLMEMCYDLEKNLFENTDQFIKAVFNHITTDLHSSEIRSQKMRDIISQHEEHKAQLTDAQNYKYIHTIVKLIEDESPNEFSLNHAFKVLKQFNTNLQSAEKELLVNNAFEESRKILIENIRILKKYLISGPTNRIVAVPNPLFCTIQEVEAFTKEQEESVKRAMELSTRKLYKTQFEKYRRQLWIYFLTDPNKLKSVFEELKLKPCAL